jgi:hypothetical protein
MISKQIAGKMIALKKNPPMESGASLCTTAGAPQSAIKTKHGTKIDNNRPFSVPTGAAGFTDDSGGLNGLSLTVQSLPTGAKEILLFQLRSTSAVYRDCNFASNPLFVCLPGS